MRNIELGGGAGRGGAGPRERRPRAPWETSRVGALPCGTWSARRGGAVSRGSRGGHGRRCLGAGLGGAAGWLRRAGAPDLEEVARVDLLVKTWAVNDPRPISTGGGTRRVQSVREGGGEGGGFKNLGGQ